MRAAQEIGCMMRDSEGNTKQGLACSHNLLTKINTFLVIIYFLVAAACSSTGKATPIVAIQSVTDPGIVNTQPSSGSVSYWSDQPLKSHFPIEKIEVAGTYEAIGYSLGKWYRNKGYFPRSLTTVEQQKARAMLAFYDEVHPSIHQQLQGVYQSYDMSLNDVSHGIPIWDDEEIRILLPGLVEPGSCSVVFSRPEMAADGHARLGRNHDWPKPLTDTLLVFTYPEEGYPTVVMTRGTPGFSASDGVNSQGLAFGLASVRNVGYESPSDPSMPSNSAYRLVLEHSANVEEAIAMLRSIPIAHVNSNHDEVISHILLADRGGDSAVVEFLPEGLVVSRTDSPFQVMTNSHWSGPADQSRCERYRTAVSGLEETIGEIDDDGFRKIMSSVQNSTQWSIIYDLEDLSLILSFPSTDGAAQYEFSLAEFITRMAEQ